MFCNISNYFLFIFFVTLGYLFSGGKPRMGGVSESEESAGFPALSWISTLHHTYLPRTLPSCFTLCLHSGLRHLSLLPPSPTALPESPGMHLTQTGSPDAGEEQTQNSLGRGVEEEQI